MINEETFKKILYLIFKVTIQNSGFLSQLEIFRDVRFLMDKSFGIKESDLIVKIGQGKHEDFKDILNFILTILCELALVSQKMENKSFYFKWTGFKGFRKKYLVDLFENDESNFDMSESFEHRIQIYTRLLLKELYDKTDEGITEDEDNILLKKCGLENQKRHTDKIHLILKFLDLIESINQNSVHHQIFTLVTKENQNLRGNEIIFKINKFYLNEIFINDTNYFEKYYNTFNELILNKNSQWNEEIVKNNQDENNDENENIEMKNEEDEIKIKSLGNIELNELEEYKINLNNFNTENEEVGFAVLRGTNWCYYIKKLYCIIGRAPIKYGVALSNTNIVEDANKTKNNPNGVNLIPNTNYGNSTWHVDVDLGQNRKISKQHALIAYNFQMCSFEIQNLSKKFPIKVNGEVIKYGEDMPITSKSLISIGNQEFYFLLPM